MKMYAVVTTVPLVIVLTAGLAAARPPRRVRHFRRIDRNHNGRIERVERVRAHTVKTRVNTPWEKRRDTNRNGRVDPWETKTFWKTKKYKVGTTIQVNYDTDHDGWLEPDEAREMLEYIYYLVMTHGKAKVNTPLERLFDEDKNGVIDRDEAEEMRDYLD